MNNKNQQIGPDGYFLSMYRNEFGRPVERTPQTHPYSYDTFVTWENKYKIKPSGSVYSDRLFQWDSEKYNTYCKKHWGNHGQYFSETPEKIEAFLRDYFSEPKLILCRVMQTCNKSSGYPIWIFSYVLNPESNGASKGE